MSHQVKMAINSDLLMIVAPSLGFVLLALLVAFFLRGKEGRPGWDGSLQSCGDSRRIWEWTDSTSCPCLLHPESHFHPDSILVKEVTGKLIRPRMLKPSRIIFWMRSLYFGKEKQEHLYLLETQSLSVLLLYS